MVNMVPCPDLHGFNCGSKTHDPNGAEYKKCLANQKRTKAENKGIARDNRERQKKGEDLVQFRISVDQDPDKLFSGGGYNPDDPIHQANLTYMDWVGRKNMEQAQKEALKQAKEEKRAAKRAEEDQKIKDKELVAEYGSRLSKMSKRQQAAEMLKEARGQSPLQRMNSDDLGDTSEIDALKPLLPRGERIDPQDIHWSPSPYAYGLRGEQEEASTEMATRFLSHDTDRLQVRMACGMGKTIVIQETIRKYEEAMSEELGENGIYLISSPNIKLSQQIRKDLEDDGILDNVMIHEVHSKSRDFKDNKSRDEDVDHIKDFVRSKHNGPKIIIAVNDSLPKVIESQHDEDEPYQFDIALFDEAHRLAPTAYQTKTGADDSDIDSNRVSSPYRVYDNRQPNGLQSKNRSWLTASPRMSGSSSYEDEPIESRVIASNIIEDEGLAPKKFEMFQDNEFFGEFVGGESWGYRYAVEKGYLIAPTIESGTIEVDIPSSAVSSRDLLLDAHGRATSADKSVVNVGSYTSIMSTADAILEGDSRNVLTFSNSVAESKQVRDQWNDVIRAKARDLYGSDMDDDTAYKIASEIPPGLSTASMTSAQKAARYTLIAKHADTKVVASSESGSDMKDWENHFDQNQKYDSKQCECGQPGRWCACARVVSNMMMLSEGINVKSIDTVVFNRQSSSTDGDIYQAMGRACRKWDGKETSKFIIPNVVSESSSGESKTRRLMPKQYSRVMSAVSRVWRDVDADTIESRGMLPEAESDIKNIRRQDILVEGSQAALQQSATSQHFPPGTEGEALVLAKLWKGAETAATSKEGRARMAKMGIEHDTSTPGGKYMQIMDYIKNNTQKNNARGDDTAANRLKPFTGISPEVIEEAQAIEQRVSESLERGDQAAYGLLPVEYVNTFFKDEDTRTPAGLAKGVSRSGTVEQPLYSKLNFRFNSSGPGDSSTPQPSSIPPKPGPNMGNKAGGVPTVQPRFTPNNISRAKRDAA